MKESQPKYNYRNTKGDRQLAKENKYKKSTIDDLKTDRHIEEAPEEQSRANYHT